MLSHFVRWRAAVTISLYKQTCLLIRIQFSRVDLFLLSFSPLQGSIHSKDRFHWAWILCYFSFPSKVSISLVFKYTSPPFFISHFTFFLSFFLSFLLSFYKVAVEESSHLHPLHIRSSHKNCVACFFCMHWSRWVSRERSENLKRLCAWSWCRCSPLGCSCCLRWYWVKELTSFLCSLTGRLLPPSLFFHFVYSWRSMDIFR